MKVLTSILAVAMAMTAVSGAALETRCLANGKACKSNGSMGNCCSGFCLAQGNNVGKCKPKAALEEADLQERDLEARCLANGKACKSNGSMGNCCSGFCLAQGNNVGKCKPKAALEEADIEERDLEARCLANGKACKSNGSMGNCCSGFCLAQGNNVGKCKPKAALEEAEVEERDLEARCLANGKACKSNGSMGNCCSGFCLAQGNKVGKCQKH